MLYEMTRKEIKIENLTHNSVFITSDDMPTHLVHKISPSMPQSAQFVAQLNPNVEK
ncbi:unnamed protein product [Hymenolepis diminuta]|uniref:Uncharacterized protein n=1 Tax=Hymenolepis diminuta TaxID=6216 RepID=A0A564Y610_HYMDI|nr:unnamed protein product [Hymenolepis diminuta]